MLEAISSYDIATSTASYNVSRETFWVPFNWDIIYIHLSCLFVCITEVLNGVLMRNGKSLTHFAYSIWGKKPNTFFATERGRRVLNSE